jgi:acetyl-CoA carboxylase/biotin carboxylase 1
MKAKGCISEVLEWRSAREFFYWRVRRRQAQDPLTDRLVHASNSELTPEAAAAKVEALVPEADRHSDKAAVTWLDANGDKAEALVQATKKEYAAKAVQKLLQVGARITDLMNE